MLVGTVVGLSPSPAEAAVTAVRGEACSYFVNVGLFGGPQDLQGCGEAGRQPTATPTATVTNDPSYSPHVRISGAGGSMSASDANGASGVYGPAKIHGGMWPCEDPGTDTEGSDVQNDNVTGNCPLSAPPSGPQDASTTGSAAAGTVTAQANIRLHTPAKPVSCWAGWGPNPPSTSGCLDYGGFGPYPVQGESLHVECSATESSVTGTTQFQNATLATSTDIEGNPLTFEDVPDNPPPNYTRHGVITNVGDVFTVVYNQQIVNADGSLTVNAVHMYLYGPTAVGEVVRGQVTCGTTPTSVSPSDTVAPTCGTPVVKPVSPEDQNPQVPRSELVGTFDAGGLQSVTNIQVTNGTVTVGYPSGLPYLSFTPGMTGPLALNATRTDDAEAAGLPLRWSFDVTDMAGNTTHCRGVIRGAVVADFNGDGTTDRSVYSDGAWYVHGQSTVFFGLAGYTPVPGDYNGDGDSERAVFKDGAWYVEGQPTVFWGLPGDVHVPGDYNGDGTTERAVFRNGAWYVEGAAPVYLGLAGYVPVPGDYDGNGTTDRAVYKDGLWYVDGQAPVNWGLAGYVPVPGDYDGNGTTDLAVYKDGAWYVQGQATGFWGLAGYVPVPGDYDGNGTTDRAVYKEGAWYVENQPTVFWGLPGHIPLPLPHAIYRSYF